MNSSKLTSLFMFIIHAEIILSSVEPYFKQECDLHNRNSTLGNKTPPSLLPADGLSDWLFDSPENIQKWYNIGKRECLDYISTTGKKTKKDFINLPDPYKFGGQRKCRGVDMLQSVSGMILWPFGPHNKECPTYSKCWFGILSCGNPKLKHLSNFGKDKLYDALKFAPHLPQVIPEMSKWSIRAMHLHIRLIGSEIVVPEQKIFSIYNNFSTNEKKHYMDDYIIAQYTLTLPDPNPIQLEVRQMELYHSYLFDWSDAARQAGIHTVAPIFLGGSEDRCAPWTRCDSANFCCGCDEKSYVIGTPIKIKVPDGSKECPGVRSKKLPYCTTTTEPGRWIDTTAPAFKHKCNIPFTGKNFKVYQNVEKISHAGFQAYIDLDIENKNSSTSTSTPPPYPQESGHGFPPHHDWFEGSGNLCLVVDTDPEDNGKKNWVWAPYRCQYHVYQRPTVLKCLKEKEITHINFQGDSMSRDLFMYVISYLGVKAIEEGELKKLTNELKMKKLEYHSGNIMVTEGNTWDFDLNTLRMAKEVPIPQVVVTNYALSHRLAYTSHQFLAGFNNSELKFWKNEYFSSKATKNIKNRYLFFQEGKALHGAKGGQLNSDQIRTLSEALRRSYVDDLGFKILDEHILTAGRVDTYRHRNDAWHFFGTMRQMESVMMFNVICNDWFFSQDKLYTP